MSDGDIVTCTPIEDKKILAYKNLSIGKNLYIGA